MRVPAPTYRFLFFVMSLVACVAGCLALWDVRKLEAAKRENEQLTRANEFANTYTSYRDQDYWFTVENYGFTYRGKTGNLIDDCILKCGAWEKFMLFFMQDYVAAAGLKDTAFMDVGANTGVHSLFMSTRIAEVHSFDPDPVILKRFYTNIELNKFTNIHVHAVGLGDREAELPFFAPDGGNEGNGSFRTGDRERVQSGTLKIVTGDAHMKTVKHRPFGLVKMDIEGFEEAGLKGIRQTIDTDRPLVIVEVTLPPQGTISSFEQLKTLFPADYEFLAFVEDDRHSLSGNYELEDFTPARAARFFNDKENHNNNQDALNLVVVPKEKMQFVKRNRAK